MLEEDNDDRFLTQYVFSQQQYNIDLRFVSTSIELFKYLDGCNKDKPFPYLIILDYHSSPANAAEILKELRKSKCAHIPAIVISGSKNEKIVRECYAAGANSFIQKPADAEGTSEKIMNFIRYWFSIVELPL